jgi:hypothetical protein
MLVVTSRGRRGKAAEGADQSLLCSALVEKGEGIGKIDLLLSSK